MEKALFGGSDEDYGPCSCKEYRATVPVAIPVSWTNGGSEEEEIESILRENQFPFAMGYDYRRCFGPVRKGRYFLNFPSCPSCCQKAAELGIAEEVEDVGFSSNVLVETLLGNVVDSEQGEN